MERVEAWKTADGKLFPIEQEEQAKIHDVEVKTEVSRDKLFKDNEQTIIDYLFNECSDDLQDDINKEDIQVYHEGKWGWNCKGDKNPIDKCIYSPQTHWRDDSCLFCGEPSERK